MDGISGAAGERFELVIEGSEGSHLRGGPDNLVYRAAQHGLGRVVALKMMLHGAHASPDELARFRAEAEAIARLRHPNIVEVYAYGETPDGLPYFALELCAGGTLAARCTEPVPAREAAALVVALARAVQHAHELGIVHRDLHAGGAAQHRAQIDQRHLHPVDLAFLQRRGFSTRVIFDVVRRPAGDDEDT